MFGVTLSTTFVWVFGVGDHSSRRSLICILGTSHKFSILMHWNLNSFSGCTSLVWTFAINVFCHPDTYVRSINKCSIMSWFGTTFQTNWIASSTMSFSKFISTHKNEVLWTLVCLTVWLTWYDVLWPKESGRQDNKPDYMYGPKQNWNFLVSYSKQHILSLSLAICHRVLLPAFTDLQQNQLMHTQIGKVVTESRTYTLHPLEWP